MRQETLFPKAEIPRRKRLVRMHVTDAGCGDFMEPGRHSALFKCGKCGHVPGWTEVTLTEGRRGIPCPACNKLDEEKAGETAIHSA